MGSRLLVLSAVGLLACAGAGAIAAHERPAARHAISWLPPAPAPAPAAARCPVPDEFRPAFVRAARDTGVQLSLLVAMAEVESRFRADARSPADARGLLQVLPSTARALRLDADRPETNVLAGARYLSQLLDRFSSTDLALAAYNAGPTAVDAAGRIAPSNETEAYVSDVQGLWRSLAGCR